jgi:MFS family permease
MKNRPDKALSVLTLVAGPTQAKIELTAIANSLSNNTSSDSLGIATLFSPTLHKVLFVGMVVAILQQITGINSVFFYAPMIFEQTGIGTDASFLQAVLVGLTNLFFTILAMLFIDKVGRRPLLLAGVSGIVVCMLMLAYGFDTARYTLPVNALSEFSEKADTLASVAGQTFRSDVAFREAISNSAGAAWYTANEARLIQISVSLNSYLILFGILGFVASFAVSLGPVMWVLFSELFPNHIRALAISVVGLVNSAVSFLVQLVFPWELATIGIAGTFFIYGFFALVGLLLVAKFLPETKGMSLEQLEVELVKS